MSEGILLRKDRYWASLLSWSQGQLVWEQALRWNLPLGGQITTLERVFADNIGSYGVQLPPTGQNSIMAEHVIYSRELSLTGIHAITGRTAAKTT